MLRGWTLAALACAAACRSATSGPSAPAASDASSTTIAADGGGARSQVELTWRLFETLHWLDGDSPHQSAIFELLVDGGRPSRVQLGRRDSSGCVVRDETDGGPTVATLECSFARAAVLRDPDGTLRVEASDRDPTRADPDARRNERTEIVRLPVDAEVSVSRELARVPDEAVPGTSVR